MKTGPDSDAPRDGGLSRNPADLASYRRRRALSDPAPATVADLVEEQRWLDGVIAGHPVRPDDDGTR